MTVCPLPKLNTRSLIRRPTNFWFIFAFTYFSLFVIQRAVCLELDLKKRSIFVWTFSTLFRAIIHVHIHYSSFIHDSQRMLLSSDGRIRQKRQQQRHIPGEQYPSPLLLAVCLSVCLFLGQLARSENFPEPTDRPAASSARRAPASASRGRKEALVLPTMTTTIMTSPPPHGRRRRAVSYDQKLMALRETARPAAGMLAVRSVLRPPSVRSTGSVRV